MIPLYAKALDFRSKRSILHDARADEIVRAIDYDFEAARSPGNRVILVARARQFDEWVRAFLRQHPHAIVLNLGCGLDARVDRIARPPTVRWFDIDFPKVIELRRRFFSSDPSYRMLGASLTESGWLGEIPRDAPSVIVADGVLEYLDPADVAALFRRLLDHLPTGEVVFDVMNRYAMGRGNRSIRAKFGAVLKWAVDDLREVDALDPRLVRLESVSVLRSPFLPWGLRVEYGIASLSTRARTAMQNVRCRFPSGAQREEVSKRE